MHIYLQSNEADGNRLIVFARDDAGCLSEPVAVATGGRGDGVPHLTSQGSVIVSGDGSTVLATNAGSNDLSVFDTSSASLIAVVPSGGSAPKSVAEHRGVVYVVNTGDRSLTGFALTDGRIAPMVGARYELGDGADPAQVGFSPDGRKLVVTDRGANAIVVFPVLGDGLLGEPRITASAGATPYGFTFANDDTLVVTEAFGAAKGKAAASSYRVNGSGADPVSRSVGNGRSEICWAVALHDGLVFTTNFADGAVSRYVVGANGELTLDDATAGIAVDGQAGLRDEDATDDGRFLYAVDADGRRVFGWAIVEGGALQPLGSWDGLPATVAGLAAR